MALSDSSGEAHAAPDSHPLVEPQTAFAELATIRFDDHDLEGVLLRVAELAKGMLPGVVDVSVTLVRGDKAYTAAFTGEQALALDETQYEAGYGPCLDVAQASGELLIADMASESRWPEFARRALAAGVHSSISIALPLQEAVVGALNVYAADTMTLDPPLIELARTFASYAAVAIANAQLYDTTASLAANMRIAMESRAVIEQAKGMLMAEGRLSADAAFALLSRLSQDTNRKLHDIATEIVTAATAARSQGRGKHA